MRNITLRNIPHFPAERALFSPWCTPTMVAGMTPTMVAGMTPTMVHGLDTHHGTRAVIPTYVPGLVYPPTYPGWSYTLMYPDWSYTPSCTRAGIPTTLCTRAGIPTTLGTRVYTTLYMYHPVPPGYTPPCTSVMGVLQHCWTSEVHRALDSRREKPMGGRDS